MALRAAALAMGAVSCVVVAQSPRQRAMALLATMNLTDKIGMLHGVPSPGYTGATAPNLARNIPALFLNDGRQGFRPNDGSPTQTAFPCELANVATFDVGMMYAFGQAMGEEFAGKGSNVALCPMLILARVPLDGRSFESIGEDPELAYHMAVAHITGLQSVPGMIANADDFVLNNAELDRQTVSAVADERTRFELYYRGYAGAVAAGVGSFMCSYNQVNGTHACENEMTLGDLKSPAGLNFTGWVLSDWGGTHSTIASALAGLDQEMPGSDYFGDALLAAVQQGQVNMSTIDDKVLRILTPMFAAGLFDIEPCPPSQCNQDTNVTSPAHTALARSIAAASTVLLANRNATLPLGNNISSIVVVGDDCDLSPQCCGAGSGALFPPYVVSPLAGITTRAGAGVNVTYFPTPTGATALTQWFSAGRGDHYVDFQCVACPTGPDAYIALRVEAYASPSSCAGCLELGLYYNGVNQSNLIAPAAGYTPPAGYTYVRPLAWALPLKYSSENTTVLELWSGMDTPTGAPPNSHLDFFTLATDASRAEATAAGYTKLMDIARVFTSPTTPDNSAIQAAAAAADVAIVCASTPSSEGSDRPNLNLTARDDAMIATVTSVQPRTVVTLNIPGGVLMPWAPSAGAIVNAWYPGQEMGNALADILWGDVNPSGRLPLTFPQSNEDTPMQTPEQYPGVNGVMNYTEKLLIGYRWWDATGTEPLFPFGHGLSYTSFGYSALNITPAVSDGSGSITVTCTVTNTGGVRGREIPQLYVGFPPAAGEPPRVLRGFSAVELLPGASVPVTFTLSTRDLSIWDVDSYSWTMVPGGFTAYVGASSRDIRLQGGFNVTAGGV